MCFGFLGFTLEESMLMCPDYICNFISYKSLYKGAVDSIFIEASVRGNCLMKPINHCGYATSPIDESDYIKEGF